MKEHVNEKLRELTSHKYVEVVNRGNAAILIAFEIASKLSSKKKVLIPDQGGWFSYKTYPKLFALEVVEVKTNRGVIDLEDLKEKSKDCSAFIFTSFAGYYAEQPLKEISSICKSNDCLVVEDATGAIGDEILCNGGYSDIIVGSFGKWKPVSVGYGGFISCKENWFDKARVSLSSSRVYSESYEKILEKLNSLDLKKYLDLQLKVKEEINVEIFHKDKRGLNVVTAYDEKIIEYCKGKEYEYVVCPKYIRVNEKAISIELKRLVL
jgi:dTDP-4-amino-4,6-dideoxygalactose transaminase